MNIGQIKFLSWATAGVLTLGLSYYVWDFVSHRNEKSALPDSTRMRKVLTADEPQKNKDDDVVAYGDIKRLFHPSCLECAKNPNCRHLNWTGKEKPPPPKIEDAVPQAPPKVKVDELLTIVMIKADLADKKNSSIFIKYKPKSGVANNSSTGGFLLHEGDHLAAPHDKVRIDEITGDAVWFAFEADEREREALKPGEFDVTPLVVQVGPDGVVLPTVGTSIPRTEMVPFNPNRTTKIAPNRYVLGKEDVQNFNDNWQKIVSQDVRTSRHQDPKTGKYDGIEINEVKPGSLAESHGAQEGDVIKSINGHPVTSVNEAVNYAKMNANKYSKWEIVVESKGKLKTIYYDSPSQ